MLMMMMMSDDDDDDRLKVWGFLSFLSLKEGVTLLAVGELRVLMPPCMRFLENDHNDDDEE